MIWFFGVLTGGMGHYVWEATPTGYARRMRVGNLSLSDLDGRFAPQGGRDQAAALVHVDGKTIVAWWDRTGDPRSGSNSAVIVDRIATADDVLDEAARVFPEAMSRQARPSFGGAR